MTRARAIAPEGQLGLFGVPSEVDDADDTAAKGRLAETLAQVLSHAPSGPVLDPTEERVRAFGEHIAANPALAEARAIAESQIGPSREWSWPTQVPKLVEPEPASEPAPEPAESDPAPAPAPAEPPDAATIVPLLKYPGGKAKLAPAILSVLFPDGWDRTRFVEPFAGPASVAHTAIARGFRGRVELYDASPIIPVLHREVAFHWPEVEREIHALPQSGVTKEVYLAVRDAFNRGAPGPKLAAQYLWLNRMCYCGLHRFSRMGFNADYGKKLDVPLSVILEAGRAARDRYAQVTLWTRQADFAAAFLPDTTPAVIYCDPPYPDGFDNYTPQGFKPEDHERLAECAQRAARQGHRVAISGGDTPTSRALYAGAEVRVIGSAARSINRDGAGRAAKVEVLYLYGNF